MFIKLTRKIPIILFLISLFIWLLLRFSFTNIFPTQLVNGLFYWELLFSLLIIRFYLKTKAISFLYTSLVIFALGAIFSIVALSTVSEFILRAGFVVFLFGTGLSLIEVARERQLNSD